MKKPGRCRRIGMVGYVQFLASLRKQPGTLQQAIATTGIGHTACWRLITSFHVLGMVHISGWAMEPGVATAPIWSFGTAPDAPIPQERPNGRPIDGVRLPRCDAPATFAVVLSAIFKALQEPLTSAELSEYTEVCITVVRDVLDAMVKHQFAHITDWAPRDSMKPGGEPVRVYLLGAGTNAPRPKAMTRKEVSRRYEQRIRQKDHHLSIMHALARPLPANKAPETATA